MDGRILLGLSEGEVTELFRRGQADLSAECRPEGATQWQPLNEHLPLLKYEVPRAGELDPRKLLSPGAGAARFFRMAQWKVGVGCFAVGLVCAGAVTRSPETADFPQQAQAPRETLIRAEPLKSSSNTRRITLSPRTSATLRRIRHARAQRAAELSVNRAATAAQSRIQNQSAATEPSKPAARKLPGKVEEAMIPLQKWTIVESDFGLFRVKIREDGPSTISVWVDDSEEPRHIEKVKGFETYGTNKVQIYSLPGAKVYYVDRLTAPVGTCVLKVIPEA